MENNQNPGMAVQPSMPNVVTDGSTANGAVTNADTSTNVVSDAKTTVVNPNAGKVANIVKMIFIVVLSMTTLAFVGLFIWMFMEYNAASSDVEGQITKAVEAAKQEQILEDEAVFAEREKEPYRDFAGPADYGQLSFKYPKTWSLYVASDASKGGDYQAYFNPIEVNPVSDTTINALRVTIRDRDYESVVSEYKKYVEARDSTLKVQSVSVGGTTANRYTGTIPGTQLSGVIVIFKIRDKTAVLRTDSVLFNGDFDKILSSVSFNA